MLAALAFSFSVQAAGPRAVRKTVEASMQVKGQVVIAADGTGRPYKAYCRSPSFVHLATTQKLILGHLIADVVPIFGMINRIGGECDK